MKQYGITLLTLLFLAQPYYAQQRSPQTTDVLTWTEGTVSPKANLDLVKWMEGNWQGPLEGNMQEHTVLAPAAGQMPGLARGWTKDGKILFYEINAFVEVEGTIEFRVKHVSSEMSAWEGKDGYVRHRLMAYTDKALFFDGITFVKDGSNGHIVYFRFPDGERKGQVIVVHQKRVR